MSLVYSTLWFTQDSGNYDDEDETLYEEYGYDSEEEFWEDFEDDVLDNYDS